MKRVRKGFTLIELLLVIAIIGILSSMMMISTTEATDSARVTKIVEGFRSVSTAMTMFYAEHADSCDRGTNADAITAGIKKFLKDANTVTSEDVSGNDLTAVIGKYAIVYEDAKNGKGDKDGSWWIAYTLPGTNSTITRIGERLQERATELGLRKAAKASDGQTSAYDGKQKVFMKVR